MILLVFIKFLVHDIQPFTTFLKFFLDVLDMFSFIFVSVSNNHKNLNLRLFLVWRNISFNCSYSDIILSVMMIK